MLGVGIIGCGAIARMHIEGYKRCPETQIRAVASGHAESARRTGEALGVPWTTDYIKLLDRGDIDLVSICTPSGLHGEAAIAAADRRIHALVEKPLEITTERIDAMIRAAGKNGTQLSCIFNNRFEPAHQFLKKAVEEGRFGRLIRAGASVPWYRERAYYSGSSWHGSWVLDGGGALMNQSIHYIDLLLWLAGKVQSVFAYTGTLLQPMEAEDTAVAVLRFENGALGSFLGTTATYPGYPASLEIAGERGSARLEEGRLTAWSFRDEDPLDEEAERLRQTEQAAGKREANPMDFAAENHCRQIAGFVRSILNGTEPEVTAREARRSVALIQAIYRSAQSGQPQFPEY